MSSMLDQLAGVPAVSVLPYDARFDPEASSLLAWMWQKMKDDDLVDYYFPGQRETGYTNFVRLFSGDASAALFITDSQSGQWADRIAGFITWTPMKLGAAEYIIAGFIFFRKYWDHHTTDDAGKVAFEFWFTKSKIKGVLGVCPSLHHTAMRYNKRVGLREIGRIPEAHLFKGEVCDAVLFALTRSQWEKGVV